MDTNGLRYNYSGGNDAYVSFVLWTDEERFYTWTIYGDGSVDYVEANVGGSSALIVTIDEETGTTASHTSTEIYAHVQSGGTAELKDNSGYIFSLVGCSEDYASFDHNYDDNLRDSILVYSDGSVEHREFLNISSDVNLDKTAVIFTYDDSGYSNYNVSDIDSLVSDGYQVVFKAGNLHYTFAGVDIRGDYASFIHINQYGRILKCVIDQKGYVTFYDDTFTESDKTEIVNAVLSALPSWEGGNY